MAYYFNHSLLSNKYASTNPITNSLEGILSKTQKNLIGCDRGPTNHCESCYFHGPYQYKENDERMLRPEDSNRSMQTQMQDFIDSEFRNQLSGAKENLMQVQKSIESRVTQSLRDTEEDIQKLKENHSSLRTQVETKYNSFDHKIDDVFTQIRTLHNDLLNYVTKDVHSQDINSILSQLAQLKSKIGEIESGSSKEIMASLNQLKQADKENANETLNLSENVKKDRLALEKSINSSISSLKQQIEAIESSLSTKIGDKAKTITEKMLLTYSEEENSHKEKIENSLNELMMNAQSLEKQMDLIKKECSNNREDATSIKESIIDLEGRVNTKMETLVKSSISKLEKETGIKHEKSISELETTINSNNDKTNNTIKDKVAALDAKIMKLHEHRHADISEEILQNKETIEVSVNDKIKAINTKIDSKLNDITNNLEAQKNRVTQLEQDAKNNYQSTTQRIELIDSYKLNSRVQSIESSIKDHTHTEITNITNSVNKLQEEIASLKQETQATLQRLNDHKHINQTDISSQTKLEERISQNEKNIVAIQNQLHDHNHDDKYYPLHSVQEISNQVQTLNKQLQDITNLVHTQNATIKTHNDQITKLSAPQAPLPDNSKIDEQAITNIINEKLMEQYNTFTNLINQEREQCSSRMQELYEIMREKRNKIVPTIEFNIKSCSKAIAFPTVLQITKLGLRKENIGAINTSKKEYQKNEISSVEVKKEEIIKDDKGTASNMEMKEFNQQDDLAPIKQNIKLDEEGFQVSNETRDQNYMTDPKATQDINTQFNPTNEEFGTQINTEEVKEAPKSNIQVIEQQEIFEDEEEKTILKNANNSIDQSLSNDVPRNSTFLSIDQQLKEKMQYLRSSPSQIRQNRRLAQKFEPSQKKQIINDDIANKFSSEEKEEAANNIEPFSKTIDIDTMNVQDYFTSSNEKPNIGTPDLARSPSDISPSPGPQILVSKVDSPQHEVRGEKVEETPEDEKMELSDKEGEFSDSKKRESLKSKDDQRKSKESEVVEEELSDEKLDFEEGRKHTTVGNTVNKTITPMIKDINMMNDEELLKVNKLEMERLKMNSDVKSPEVKKSDDEEKMSLENNDIAEYMAK